MAAEGYCNVAACKKYLNYAYNLGAREKLKEAIVRICPFCQKGKFTYDATRGAHIRANGRFHSVCYAAAIHSLIAELDKEE
jgi:hypothetical protein